MVHSKVSIYQDYGENLMFSMFNIVILQYFVISFFNHFACVEAFQ